MTVCELCRGYSVPTVTMALVLTLWPASPSWAQGPAREPDPRQPAGERIVTEAELLRRVLERPAVRAATGVAVTDALAAKQAAETLPDPRLEVGREEEGDIRELTWALAWRWPVDGRRGPRRDAAQASLEAARSEVRQERLELRHQLREAYADWALTEARRTLLAEQSRRLAELERRTRSRAERGEDSGLSARRFALAALEARGDVARAEARARRGAAAVLAWWPAAPEAEPRLPELPAAPEVDGDPLARRPDVARARARLEEARHQATGFGRPPLEPEIAVGWKTVEEGGLTADGPMVGFGVRLPFLDGDRPERRAARARVEQATARLQLVEAAARAEILGLESTYAALRAEALAARGTAAQADPVTTAAQAAFELGESAVTDLLETLRGVLAARLAALELHAAALEAHRDLELALGRPLVAPFEEIPFDDELSLRDTADSGDTLPGGAR